MNGTWMETAWDLLVTKDDPCRNEASNFAMSPGEVSDCGDSMVFLKMFNIYY